MPSDLCYTGPYQQPTDRVCVGVCFRRLFFLVAPIRNSGESSGFRTPEAPLASPSDRGTWSRLQDKHTHRWATVTHTSWRHVSERAKKSDELTNSLLQPAGFIFPPHTKHVDRNARDNDGKAYPTLHRRFPEWNDDEEQTGQHEAHRQQDIHLRRDDMINDCCICTDR